MKKGMNILDRIQVSHMAQMQNMFDFPPAPKLTVLGKLDPKLATERELRWEQLFFGKAQCAVGHPAPFYVDDKMQDRSQLPLFFEAGILARGIFPERPRDVAGFGIFYGCYSSDLRNAERLARRLVVASGG
jgi:cytochrome c peroxidase